MEEMLRLLKEFNDIQVGRGHCDKVGWDGVNWVVIHHPYGCDAEEVVCEVGRLEEAIRIYRDGEVRESLGRCLEPKVGVCKDG
jgi:hypothetical protein